MSIVKRCGSDGFKYHDCMMCNREIAQLKRPFNYFQVQCDHCDCRGPLEESPEAAISQWNQIQLAIRRHRKRDVKPVKMVSSQLPIR